MTYLTDDEIVAQLAQALRAEPVAPDAATWAALEAALAGASAPVSLHRARRLRGRRASALVVTLASALTVSGAAAAAVATNTLPGPLRSIAYNLGLPVTSPQLYQAQQEESTLKASLRAHQHTQAHAVGESLATHLRTLDHSDRSSIESTADGLLREAGVPVPGLTGVTTTTSVASDQGGDSGTSGDQNGQGGSGTSQGGSSGGSSDSSGSTSTTLLIPVPTLPVVGGDN